MKEKSIHGAHVNPSLKKKNLWLQRKFLIPKWCSSASACRFLLGYNQSLRVDGGYGHKENVAIWRNQSDGRATINPMPFTFANSHFCTWLCKCLHMPLTCLFWLHTITCLPCTTQFKNEKKKSRIALQDLQREIPFCVHIAAATRVWAKETCVVVSRLSF
jgi:hypothetical protein